MIMSEKKHGGAREGAGRKPKYASMKVMKVPTDYIPAIKALIQHLDETDYLEKGYPKQESEPLFFRSRQLKAQEISFITSPVNHEKQLDLIDHINKREN